MFHLFDAHIHLCDSHWPPGAIEQLVGEDVLYWNNATRMKDWTLVLEQSAGNAQITPFLGIHPWFVEEAAPGWYQQLERVVASCSHAGIGEIGLDRRCRAPFDLQLEVFRQQLHLAAALGRPLSIHCVRAWGKLIEELIIWRKAGARSPFMVHSFSGSLETMHRLVGLGGYISFSPLICRHHGQKLHAVLEQVPEDLLLLESDGPDQLFVSSGETKALETYTATIHSVYETVSAVRTTSLDNLYLQVQKNGSVFTDPATSR